MTQPPDGTPRIPPLAAEGLRLSAAAGLAEITRMALDAVVPGFADAAALFTAEHLLRDGDPVGAGRRAPGPVTVRRTGVRLAGHRDAPPLDAPPLEDLAFGDAMVFPAGSPYGRCLTDGKPVAYTDPDRWTLETGGPGREAVFSGYASFLAVPMIAGPMIAGPVTAGARSAGARSAGPSSAAGFLALARGPGRPQFGDSDIDSVTGFAASAGAGLVGALALRRHQSVAGALQRGLLAAEPEEPEHIEVAGRCLPAEGHIVGGDWYDIVALPGERAGIIVGDVMGHGPGAAAVMAQLRAAANVLAQLDVEPADLLRRLNCLIATLYGVPLATCAYAVIDPGGRCAVYAAAGHLPPVLARPDGAVRVLDLPSGQSLGIGPADYGQARIKLPPGAILALYTDGLVETRTRPFEEGIAALTAELARTRGALPATRDALIGAVAGGDPEDDITLVLARTPADSNCRRAGQAPRVRSE